MLFTSQLPATSGSISGCRIPGGEYSGLPRIPCVCSDQWNCGIHIVAILKADAPRGARDYEEHQRTSSAKCDPAAQWIDPDRPREKERERNHSTPPAIATGTEDSAELEASSTAALKSEGA